MNAGLAKPSSRKTRKPTPEALAMRRDFNLRPGDTLHTVLRHCAPSGMSRHIAVLRIRADRKAPGGVRIWDLTGRASQVLGLRLNKDRDGLVVGGCGMDMGFEVVYRLGSLLFPNGFKVGPKTAHRNGIADGTTDPDGGYAFAQRWL